MKDSEPYSFRSIYRDYMEKKFRDELHGEWGAVVFYRGPAILLTPLLLKYSVKPTVVSVFSLMVVMAIPLTLLLPEPIDFIYLSTAGILFHILDCIDGNIARITNSHSRIGRYTDFIADMLQRIFIYLTLGLLIQSGMTVIGLADLYPFLLMVIAALLAVMARLSREYAMAALSVTAAAGPENGHSFREPGPVNDMKKIGNMVFSFLSGLDTLTPFLILVSGLLGQMGWLPWWLVFYSLLDFLHTQFVVVRKIQ